MHAGADLTVDLLGYRFAFEGEDTLSRKRIDVTRVGPGLAYSIYVVYDHTPTNDDRANLALLGMPVLFRYEALPAFRSLGSFPQVQAASAPSSIPCSMTPPARSGRATDPSTRSQPGTDPVAPTAAGW